jgi:hypothetical protein
MNRHAMTFNKIQIANGNALLCSFTRILEEEVSLPNLLLIIIFVSIELSLEDLFGGV